MLNVKRIQENTGISALNLSKTATLKLAFSKTVSYLFER